ncbi:ABC transporter permease [Xanthobacter autotrophicus DSM 431]|uniref:ABC transporter permease n=1 Tax=Xanthobacter nonsaccharivorans TaxID=3119912 RepID=UPI0037285535
MSLAEAPRPSLLTGTDRAFVALSRLTALALLVTLLAIASPAFLTYGNLSNVLRQASLQFVMSAGLTAVVITGGIDLSVGAMIGLSACLGGALLAGGSILGGITAALVVGLACGLFNGVMVAYLRIPSFIATYGMLWIAFGLGYVFMMGEVIYGFPPAFRFIAVGYVGPVPMLVVMAAIVLFGMHVVLTRTPFGRSLYAIGGNANAARLSGMPVQRRLVLCYGLSGLMAGLAGLLAIARTNAADAGLGEELLLPTIAAVALGGTSLAGGTGGIVGTAIGAIILSLIINGMNLLGVKTFWQAFAMGTLILISVATDEIIRRRKAHVA